MARIHLTLPDELAQQLDKHPSLNVSALLRDALQRAVACDHTGLACRGCGAHLERDHLEATAARRLYSAARGRLAEHARAGRTAIGFGQVLRDIARDLGADDGAPLPRLYRADYNPERHPA